MKYFSIKVQLIFNELIQHVGYLVHCLVVTEVVLILFCQFTQPSAVNIV